MRQAINNLQSTHSGFGFVSADNVFKVCDQPHPILVQAMIRACLKGDINTAMEKLNELWDQGYSAVDIVVTIFRVTKAFDEQVFFHALIFYLLTSDGHRLPEYTKLEYIKEIGWTHMRILEGVGTLVQLGGLMARLCKMVSYTNKRNHLVLNTPMHRIWTQSFSNCSNICPYIYHAGEPRSPALCRGLHGRVYIIQVCTICGFCSARFHLRFIVSATVIPPYLQY